MLVHLLLFSVIVICYYYVATSILLDFLDQKKKIAGFLYAHIPRLIQAIMDVAVTQQEIVSLYQRFCQLDRNAKGFISADEFLSVPEFALNPLSQV